MCSYCNGLEIVIGLDGRPKNCPVCVSPAAGANTEADRAWIESHWMAALLHALQMGCPNDDEDCLDDLTRQKEITM